MIERRDVFQALADPTRRAILVLLLRSPTPVGALAERFAVTRQAISLHVRILEECSVIKVHKQGRERICALQPGGLAEAADWLEPFVDLWRKRFDQLDGILREEEEDEHDAE